MDSSAARNGLLVDHNLLEVDIYGLRDVKIDSRQIESQEGVIKNLVLFNRNMWISKKGVKGNFVLPMADQ